MAMAHSAAALGSSVGAVELSSSSYPRVTSVHHVHTPLQVRAKAGSATRLLCTSTRENVAAPQQRCSSGWALSAAAAIVAAAAATGRSVSSRDGRRRQCHRVALAASGAVEAEVLEPPARKEGGPVGSRPEPEDAVVRKENIVRSRRLPQGLTMVPPEEVRRRIRVSRGMLGKEYLAIVGDSIWEFLVLMQQYKQLSKTPGSMSRKSRSLRQAHASQLLYRGTLLNAEEKETLYWGTRRGWKKQAKLNPSEVQEVGYEVFSAATGLRTLLGYLYLDDASSDARLATVARQLGLMDKVGEEDALLTRVTSGVHKPSRPPALYFMALAPLGYVVLRLYVGHYLTRNPLTSEEFLYKTQVALIDEEIDLAAVGFVRDFATSEEIQIMKSARERKDTYGFAFQCLLGHLALTKPFRLHQILADFGWAAPLPGT